MSTASNSNSSSAAVSLRFSLEITKGPHAGLKVDFEKSKITIGRGPENDLVLAEDPRISRQHAEIKQSMGQFYIVNLSQKNFILVDNLNVQTEKIDSKSVLQIGESEMLFSIQGSTNHLEPISAGSVSIPLNRKDVTVVPIPAGSPVNSVPKAPMARPGGIPVPPSPGLSQLQGQSPPRAQMRQPPIPSPEKNKKMIIYGAIGLVVFGFFFMNANKKSKRVEDKPFRSIAEIDLSRQDSENEIKVFQERKEKMDQQIYQKAYENFLRGYRDYRQGQYSRAREFFQVVLNLDPDNELARRYLNLAKIRFDEIVKYNMLQGRRYLEKHNYRMCRASYQSVMTMLGNDLGSSEYKEALTMHKECSVAQTGRY